MTAPGTVRGVKVATFNILHGQRVLGAPSDLGGLPDVDPLDLAAAAGALGVDVLGMQEVDAHQERSGGVDQTKVAADAMGGGTSPQRLFVPSVVGTPGHRAMFRRADDEIHAAVIDGPLPEHGPLYGVSLISRLPVRSWHRVTFNAPRVSLPLLVPALPRPRIVTVPDEPRAAVAAVVETASGLHVTVATAHLSFVPGVNAAQLRRLVSWLKPFPRPLVLMGDFNLPGALPELITRWPGVVKGPTYPSFGPRVQFDHILLDGFDAKQIAAARESVQIRPMGVSDHCAVSAYIPIGVGASAEN
jgi:endonuclease/exonuclease/phosphatase family metal-dependent hydrolase